MKATRLLTSSALKPLGRGLRTEFETIMGRPELATSERFCWDPWYVRGEYNLLRAPADYLFSEKSFSQFRSALCDFGAKNFACPSVSPLWVSLYTEGHFQKMHSDFPHGAWAFVYSLNPRKILFKGGETLVAKDTLCDFWRSISEGRDTHESDFFESHLLKQGELLVFDSRLPHLVNQVRGVDDPMEGRLVLHGWFETPEPWAIGNIAPSFVKKKVVEFLDLAGPVFESEEVLHGFLCLKFNVTASGKVELTPRLRHSLVDRQNPSRSLAGFFKRLEAVLLNMDFRCKDSASTWHIPLVMK